jgi:putative copper export protein
MLRADWHTLRLTLHILAATIWIGGQLTLAGLLPVLRSLGPDAPRQAARRFNTIAWSAYGVLVATGIWHLFHVGMADRTTEYHITLGVKLLVVGLSGAGAAVHSFGRTKVALAVGGAASLVGAITALVLGVMLRG